MRKIIFFLMLFSLPLTLLAGDYELCVKYNPSSKDMRDGWMQKYSGTYVFGSKSDYIEAKEAYEELLNRLTVFDRELLKDNSGTEQERYERFLARLARCREASQLFERAIYKGSKQ